MNTIRDELLLAKEEDRFFDYIYEKTCAIIHNKNNISSQKNDKYKEELFNKLIEFHNNNIINIISELKELSSEHQGI
ncbi:MAG: hypothetical protein AAF639_01955, partial [Chloroflexota bacterium]